MAEAVRIPTQDEIRAMDGRALSRLAFHLGLAPSEARYPEGCVYVYVPHAEDERAWRPHKRLDDADAVFRTLRQHGWHAYNSYKSTPVGSRVVAYAAGMTPVVCEYGDGKDTEALSLVRCACLARAAQQREEVTDGLE